MTLAPRAYPPLSGALDTSYSIVYRSGVADGPPPDDREAVMAHIPQDARYVDPPSEREVDEDAVTEEAEHNLRWHGYCLPCRAGLMPDAPDALFLAWVKVHAESCDKLRAKAEDRLYGEAE